MKTLTDFLNKSDYEWYKEVFNRSEQKKLSEEQMDEIIQKSVETAENVFHKVKNKFDSIGINEMINQYGTDVSYNDLNDSDTVIAMYDRNINVLIVFNHSLDTLHRRIEDIGMGDILDRETLKQLVISHELYHIVEMNEENIYTYSELYESKILGFARKSKIKAASEIGAYHFSKLVTGIQYSPCIIGSLQELTAE